MDGTRFDALTRTLMIAGSRRRALALALSGTAGILGLTQADDAAAGGKCKPKCNECETCKKGKNGKKGKCKPKGYGTGCATGTCQSGKCVTASAPPPPNDAACNGTGRYLNGICNPEPTCMPFGNTCVEATTAACCSGVCPIPAEVGANGYCARGGAGTQCKRAIDCTSGSCIGYRCQ